MSKAKRTFKFDPADWSDPYYSFEVDELQGCCGVSILFDFNYEKSFEDFKSFYEEVFEEDLIIKNLKGHEVKKLPESKLKKLWEDRLQKEIEITIDERSGHIYQAVLIDDQLSIWRKPLEKNGFRLVSDRTVNRTSSNRLYVFLRDPISPKGKSVKKSSFKRG